MIPKPIFYHREICRLCGDRNVEPVVRLAPVPLITPNIRRHEELRDTPEIAREIPLDLYHCGKCGHIQLLDVVAPEIIYGDYLYRTSISVGLPEHFRELAMDVIARIRPPSGALVVEIGSNDGSQLRCFKAKGLKVLGVDPARAIAEDATRNGLETLTAFFSRALAEKIRASHGEAAIIIANNVIANIDDLDDVAEGIALLLAPDGVFVMETSYALDVFEHCLIDTIYHEHVSYFLVAPLVTFFARHGLELSHVRKVSTKGGSIRITVQRKDAKRPVDESVARAIAAEIKAGVDRREVLKQLSNRIDTLRDALIRMLSADSQSGRSVAGYGASVGTQSLIHQLGLGRFLACVIDDNPLKEVLVGPDFRLPIVSADWLYTNRPGSVVILAWRYAEGILGRHVRYLQDGGRFVVPLPELSVVEGRNRALATG